MSIVPNSSCRLANKFTKHVLNMCNISYGDTKLIIQGLPGERGVNGIPGLNGPPGEIGLPGSSGPRGPTGTRVRCSYESCKN